MVTNRRDDKDGWAEYGWVKVDLNNLPPDFFAYPKKYRVLEDCDSGPGYTPLSNTYEEGKYTEFIENVKNGVQYYYQKPKKDEILVFTIHYTEFDKYFKCGIKSNMDDWGTTGNYRNNTDKDEVIKDVCGYMKKSLNKILD